MDALSILGQVSAEQGLVWNDWSMLNIACEYINNQQDLAAFADYVRRRAEDEQETPFDDDSAE